MLFLVSNLAQGQKVFLTTDKLQKSTIDVKGSNNSIKVIQGNNVVVYDLTKDADCKKLLNYITTIPQISQDIKNILKNGKQILYLINKINEDGLFNTSVFITKIEEYIRENEKLKRENSELIEQMKGSDFANILQEARKRLEIYDNDGYQQVLEKFKIESAKKISLSMNNFARAAFLQAQNSNNNYHFEKANEQINEALELEPDNINYLFVRAQIQYSLLHYKESIESFLLLLPRITDSISMAKVYYALGHCYKEIGEYPKALEYSKKAVDIREKMAETQVGLAHSYNNLGSIYFMIGNNKEALAYFTKALMVQEKIFGINSRESAICYNNIGTAYCEYGIYDQALIYFTKASTILVKEMDALDPEIATIFVNTGAVCYFKGDYSKALDFYLKALNIQEKVFGIGHPNTAFVSSNIGLIYLQKKDYQKSLSYFNKAELSQVKASEKNSYIISTIYNNTGLVYKELGDLQKALDYYKRDLSLFEEIQDSNQTRIAITYNNIGLVYLSKNLLDTALLFFKKALWIQEKAQWTNHIEAATSYSNISSVYYKKCQYDTAFKYAIEGLKIQEKSLGDNHSESQSSLLNVGLLCIISGEINNGLTYLNRNKLSLYDKAIALINNGSKAVESNKFKESINLFVVALDFLAESKTPESNVAWMAVCQNLAWAYCKEGINDKAKALFEKAIKLSTTNNSKQESKDLIKKNYKLCGF